MKTTTLCGVVVNDMDQILPYTCQSTVHACEEWAEENLLAWDKLQKMGARIVMAEITLFDTTQNPIEPKKGYQGTKE